MATLDSLEERRKEIEARIERYDRLLTECKTDLATIERQILEQTTLREFEAFQTVRATLVADKQEQTPFAEFEKLMRREVERLALLEATKPKKGRKKKEEAKY